jgi:succinoglycan biosynthesis protein ExoA
LKISVIIPTLNERAHIEQLISSINQQEDIDKEILIVDGGSDDGTAEKVLELADTHPNLRLISNPDRYVSQGFNRAFATSRGRFISLVGAHAQYPPHYFSKCVEAIESGECDAAGGFLVQRGKTMMGKAIGQAMSSRFGVGDTHFRTTRKRMYVDSVAFAVYDRKIFDAVGLLDEALVRNQDDEFHYRLNQAGFRMLMLPELEVIYYVRDSLSKLYSQYYQYGFYKPLVLKKVNSGMRLRHLIPAFFVMYLFSLPLAFWCWWWVLPLCFYLVLSLYFSLQAPAPWSVRCRIPMVFPTLHIAYGWGFLRGLARR